VSTIDRVAAELARLPGIGPRTALRLVHHLLRGDRSDARRLARAIEEMADRVRSCAVCGNVTEEEECSICSDPRRDRSVICVVEGAFDVGAVERTGQFRGLFHVLGGHLSPLDGIGPDQLNIRALATRIEAEEGGVREVILATNPRVEGEATAVYLEGLLRPLGVRVTRLARGMPVGSDLEYVDGSTLAEALAGRREM
jgi:recombination protein RecR